jgi:hypothetical protein
VPKRYGTRWRGPVSSRTGIFGEFAGKIGVDNARERGLAFE